MTVIALARDVHSPGKEIGAAIAAHLGIDYVDRKMLLGLVAGSAGLDVETIERLVTGGASLFDRWMISQHRISRLTVSQIVRLAAKDNQLIEDCGATALLRLVRHVICIGIRPCAARTSDLARKPVYALDPAAAKSLHLKGPMRCDSETITGLCDLVIDPNRESVPQCVEVVARLVQSPRFLPTEEITRHTRADHLERGAHSIPDLARVQCSSWPTNHRTGGRDV